jgi:hypothetical protein
VNSKRSAGARRAEYSSWDIHRKRSIELQKMIAENKAALTGRNGMRHVIMYLLCYWNTPLLSGFPEQIRQEGKRINLLFDYPLFDYSLATLQLMAKNHYDFAKENRFLGRTDLHLSQVQQAIRENPEMTDRKLAGHLRFKPKDFKKIIGAISG